MKKKIENKLEQLSVECVHGISKFLFKLFKFINFDKH